MVVLLLLLLGIAAAQLSASPSHHHQHEHRAVPSTPQQHEHGHHTVPGTPRGLVHGGHKCSDKCSTAGGQLSNAQPPSNRTSGPLANFSSGQRGPLGMYLMAQPMRSFDEQNFIGILYCSSDW